MHTAMHANNLLLFYFHSKQIDLCADLMISHNRKTGRLGFDILIETRTFDFIYLSNVSYRYSHKTVYLYTALVHINVEISTPHFSYILILNFLVTHKTAENQGFHPFMHNRISLLYQLDDSILNLRVVEW